MSRRYELRLSGTGGQGVVLAGIILAEAAGRWRADQHVVQTVSYGPQVRGGLSSAEVVISDEPIDYPKPLRLDLLIPFTQEAAAEGAGLLKPQGILVQDPALVDHAPPGWVAEIPLTALARETAGRAQSANIVALGVVAVLCPFVDPEALEAAIRERTSARLLDSFLKAAEAGRRAAESIKDRIFLEEEPSPED
ncbi:MAG: 2-oxoacid:acceptor oxidoreductase family protein [Thermodesulfobacteriota bacterium]